MKQIKDIYIGEVKQITPEYKENIITGYGKTVASVVITLSTTKESKQLRLDSGIYDKLQMNKITIGDIITIESRTGEVKRLGRSDRYLMDHDLENDKFEPLPSGQVHQNKEIISHATLYDLDLANVQSTYKNEMMSHKVEMSDKLRKAVNEMVNKYVANGTAQVVPGVLFIDEVHMLDSECFAFLNRALESPLSPIVVFATNRGMTTVRGTEDISAHGIPEDLLDRLLVICTKQYKQQELMDIINKRALIENVGLTEEALLSFANLAMNTSLRFALQMLVPTSLIAKSHGRNEIHSSDVQEGNGSSGECGILRG